jgi:hypothetical protein
MVPHRIALENKDALKIFKNMPLIILSAIVATCYGLIIYALYLLALG